ncbi:MAG: SDR family NAD(P)-dependent oxidoreductase [Kineosporiaceae bacterium]
MIDALGRPQSVLLLGGTSEIGIAIVRALPPERLRRLVLAGRDPARLEPVGKEFAGGPAAGRAMQAGGPGLTVPAVEVVAVEVVAVDAVATDTHAQIVDAVFDAGDIDVTVLAVGHLGDQAVMQAEPALAVRSAEANFVGPLSLMLHVGRRLRTQGHGVLVVLSSVAGRQARPANYVYGAGKAGLDLAALGLGDSLTASGARVVVVRPGFVRTRMTAHLPTPPLAVGPDDVARAVVDGIHRRRTVVYSPPAARLLSWGLTLAPRSVLRRLPF